MHDGVKSTSYPSCIWKIFKNYRNRTNDTTIYDVGKACQGSQDVRTYGVRVRQKNWSVILSGIIRSVVQPHMKWFTQNAIYLKFVIKLFLYPVGGTVRQQELDFRKTWKECIGCCVIMASLRAISKRFMLMVLQE